MNRTLARLLFVPTLAHNLFLCRVLRLWRSWDRVDDTVVIGAMPFASDVPRLRELGVTGVINMCEEYAGPAAAYAKHCVTQLWLPTIDFSSPSLDDVERGVAFLTEHRSRGESVYVHCKAGRGRSATVVLCWLIATQGLTPEQAAAALRAKRPQIARGIERRQVVQEFHRRAGSAC